MSTRGRRPYRPVTQQRRQEIRAAVDDIVRKSKTKQQAHKLVRKRFRLTTNSEAKMRKYDFYRQETNRRWQKLRGAGKATTLAQEAGTQDDNEKGTYEQEESVGAVQMGGAVESNIITEDSLTHFPASTASSIQ